MGEGRPDERGLAERGMNEYITSREGHVMNSNLVLLYLERNNTN